MNNDGNLKYLIENIIPNFFDIKSNKTSHETLYNSSDGKNLISGYIPLDNSDKHFYTHICYHTMKNKFYSCFWDICVFSIYL